jgi:N-glycosylase/DNA lyase
MAIRTSEGPRKRWLAQISAEYFRHKDFFATMKVNKSVDTEDLMERYRERRHAILIRLSDFASVPASEYFYELVYCLMTPQSSAINADRVVSTLRQRDFQQKGFDPTNILRSREHYIRFHKNKSRYLLEAREINSVIVAVVTDSTPGRQKRDWLVRNVNGLGYKEATHFLRNIGKNDGLAILDRHILRNLKRYGAIRSIPDSLTPLRYCSIEARFQHFSQKIEIPLDELDLLFWSLETGEIRK